MTIAVIHRTSRRAAIVRTLLFWALVALVTWLDHGLTIGAQHAAVFSFIVTALSWVASALEAAGAYIAVELQVVVEWLMGAMSWVIRRIANIAINTGAIFSKAWDGIRLVWNDIIKPVVQWVDAALTRLETWLRKTFEPVFRFFRAVRAQLDGIYKRFFAPVLDTIDVIRQTNRVLNSFHIHLLDALDGYLTNLEQKIQAPFMWIYGRLNLLTDWVNRIVTVDGLFQRVALLRSLERDVLYSWRILMASRSGALTDAQRAELASRTKAQTANELAAQFREYYLTGGGPLAAQVNAAVAATLALPDVQP